MNNTYYFNANNYFNNDIQLFATNLTPKQLMSYNFANDRKTKLKAIQNAKNSLVICSNTQGCGIVSITRNANSETYNIKLITPIINENYLNEYYEFDVKNFINEQNTDDKLVYLDTIQVSGTNIHKMFLNNDNLKNAYDEIINNCEINNDDILNLSGSYAQLNTNIEDLSKEIDSLNYEISNLPANFASDINSIEQSMSKLEESVKKIDGDELLTADEIEYIKMEISGIYDKISGCNNYYNMVIESIDTLSGINSNINELRTEHTDIITKILNLNLEDLISEYKLNNLKDDDELYNKLQEYIKKMLSSNLSLDYKTLLNDEVKELLQNLYSKENNDNEDGSTDDSQIKEEVWNVYGGYDENGGYYYVWADSEKTEKIPGKWYTYHTGLFYSWISGPVSKLDPKLTRYTFFYKDVAWCFVPDNQDNLIDESTITGIVTEISGVVTGSSETQISDLPIIPDLPDTQITGSNSQTNTGTSGNNDNDWPLTPTTSNNIYIDDSVIIDPTIIDPVIIDNRYKSL